jgi:GPH family glycoside/pentoside/hexuronide:cation symporter
VALARCLDVLLTPYMSILSDHCRSKYGRRLPFCFIGTFFYVFFLLMVCSPPTSLTPSELTGWFGCSYIGLFLSYTFLSIPYDALGPELTDLHDDRSMLYWTSGMFEASGTIIGIVLPGLLAVTGLLFNLLYLK